MLISNHEVQIEPAHWAIVKSILETEPYRFGFFGSRTKSSSHKCSDLDIVIFSTDKLPPCYISDLKEQFAESDLPYFVDIVEYNACDNAFKRIIDSHSVSLPTT